MSLNIVLVENDIKSFQGPMEAEMDKPIKHFERELLKVRTGRAHTSLIEDIPVEAYGQEATPLKNMAALAAPDARLLTIQPWDTNILGAIEKAINMSDLGLTPVSDGKFIRLRLPEMSTARREELVKVLGKKAEECKVAIRNIRKEFNNVIRDAKKDKVISENFFSRLEDVLQKVTDAFIDKTEVLRKKKETDITTL